MPPILIVGLGNPGRAYEGTFHNAGRETAIAFAKKHKLEFREQKNAYVAAGDGLLVQLPNTFMNNSGEAVQPLMNRKAIPPENLIVLVDDTYIEMGKIRIKPSGSSAGHNGMGSIEDSLGTREWKRIRIGVGPDPGGDFRADYVLSRPRREIVADFIRGKELALAGLEMLLEKGLAEAMNVFNGG